MLVKSIPLSKSIAAVTADVRFLPGMGPHVPLPQVVEGKTHPALVALEALYTAVDHQMPRVGPVQTEPSPARHASVPLLHRVDRLVLRQSFPRSETFSARLALERRLACVHAEVEPETPGVDKRPAADAAVMVLSSGVKGQVRLQTFRRRKGTSAFVAVVVFRRVIDLSVVAGPVRRSVRPHVRFQSRVVLARTFADRTDSRLDACPGQHVGAQRVGISQEFPADGAHAGIPGAVHPRHVLRELCVRAAADCTLLRNAAPLVFVRSRRCHRHLSIASLATSRPDRLGIIGVFVSGLNSQQRRDRVRVFPAVHPDVCRE